MGIISTLKQMIAGSLASSSDVNSNFENLRTASNDNTVSISKIESCFFRQPSTSYKVNDVVYIPNSQYCLVCMTSGTTSNEIMTFTNVGDRASVVDGSVVWQAGYRSFIVGSAITSGSALPLGSIIPTALIIDDNDNSFKSLNGQYLQQLYFPDFYSLVLTRADEGRCGVCTETQFESDIQKYGQCGKFVIDKVNQKIRLPLVTRFIGGISSMSDLGNTYQDQIKNITGYIWTNNSNNSSGVFEQSSTGEWGGGRSDATSAGYVKFDASKQVNTGAEVQPKHSKFPYYIVVSQTSRKGLDGKDGVDAVSPEIAVISQSENECYLEISDKNGTQRTPNIKGRSPVKGIDYFTPEEIEDIAMSAADLIVIDSLLMPQKEFESFENTSIILKPLTSIYNISPKTDIVFDFDVSELILSPKDVITFELLINMPEIIYRLTFPENVRFLDVVNYSELGSYLFVFRSFNQGQTWIANAQGNW